jgi:hypothetical protein
LLTDGREDELTLLAFSLTTVRATGLAEEAVPLASQDSTSTSSGVEPLRMKALNADVNEANVWPSIGEAEWVTEVVHECMS